MSTLTYFSIKIRQSLSIWINVSSRLRILYSWKIRATLGNIHRWFRLLKVLQIRGRGRGGRDERANKNEKLSTKAPSRLGHVYYTGRQYNTTIMIRIKFTPCTSRNGACRRRRALRFGIESNLGSNPFGCVRECVTRVYVYVTRTFSRRLSV